MLTDTEVLDGSICRGTPLMLGDEEVFFRSARFSPHSASVLVCVADNAGGVLAVDPAELERLDPEG